MGASTRRSGGLVTDINVTPLVDVVLVLLVLMMVTATAIASRTIAVQLPEARSGRSEGAASPLVVAVDERGALFLDTRRVTEDEVRAAARAARAADPGTSAVLAADDCAQHGAVVRALDLLRSERVVKIAIVVREGGEGP